MNPPIAPAAPGTCVHLRWLDLSDGPPADVTLPVIAWLIPDERRRGEPIVCDSAGRTRRLSDVTARSDWKVLRVHVPDGSTT